MTVVSEQCSGHHDVVMVRFKSWRSMCLRAVCHMKPNCHRNCGSPTRPRCSTRPPGPSADAMVPSYSAKKTLYYRDYRVHAVVCRGASHHGITHVAPPSTGSRGGDRDKVLCAIIEPRNMQGHPQREWGRFIHPLARWNQTFKRFFGNPRELSTRLVEGYKPIECHPHNLNLD